MSITTSVADVLNQQVVLTVESIDRMYLSALQPRLQIEKNAASFFLSHRQVFFVKELRVTTQISNTTGRKIPWLSKSSAMVNHYDFYCVDEDFGPFFIKFCSYFPYTA